MPSAEIGYTYGQIAAIAGLVATLDESPQPDDPQPQPGDTCLTCNGTGKVGDGTVFSKCLDCDGTGKVIADKPVVVAPVVDYRAGIPYAQARLDAIRTGQVLVVLITTDWSVEGQLTRAALADVPLGGCLYAELDSSDPTAANLLQGPITPDGKRIPQVLVFARNVAGLWKRTHIQGLAGWQELAELIATAREFRHSGTIATSAKAVDQRPTTQPRKRRPPCGS